MVAGSQIVLATGPNLIASTLSPGEGRRSKPGSATIALTTKGARGK